MTEWLVPWIGQCTRVSWKSMECVYFPSLWLDLVDDLFTYEGVENSKEKFLRINRNSSKSNLKCVSREVEMLKIKGIKYMNDNQWPVFRSKTEGIQNVSPFLQSHKITILLLNREWMSRCLNTAHNKLLNEMFRQLTCGNDSIWIMM